MHCEFYYLKEKASINCQITNCHVQLCKRVSHWMLLRTSCAYIFDTILCIFFLIMNTDIYLFGSVLSPLDGLQINSVLNHFPQRTHLPQPLDMMDNSVGSVVDLRFGRKPTNSKPD